MDYMSYLDFFIFPFFVVVVLECERWKGIRKIKEEEVKFDVRVRAFNVLGQRFKG